MSSEHIESLKAEEKDSLSASDEPTGSLTKQADNNWIAGVVLIVIGGIFLLAELTDFYLNNWWALFILIPAIINFGNAWKNYQEHGRFTSSARGSLIGGLVLSTITAVFLFGMDWGQIWPVFLIIAGFGALIGGRFD